MPVLSRKNALSAALTAGVLFGGADSLFSQRPLSLAPSSASARVPRLESGGFQTTLSWLETGPEGETRVRNLLVNDGRLPHGNVEARIRNLSEKPVGQVSELDVALSPGTSNSASLWVRQQEDGSALTIRDRRQDSSETIFQSDGLLELPVLEYDSEGKLYAAWSEISGGQSRVYAATRSEDGDWISRDLSATTRPYDVLPQIFAAKQGAELYWFSIDEDKVLARMADLSASGFEGDTVRSLGSVPANRLPILYQTGIEGQLGAFWLEQRETGEAYMDLDPRATDTATPLPIGDLDASPEQPAVSDDPYACKVWIESTPEGGRQLVAESPFREDLIRVPATRTTREPVISVSDNYVHLAWLEENLEAGGSLFYLRTR